MIINRDDQLHWFGHIPEDQIFMIAECRSTGAKIGVAVYTDIDWINRSLNISGSIFANYRQPGFVKPAFSAGLDFAFEMLNMRRVGAEVLATNKPSQELEINHLGFTVEGIRRQAVYKCGIYIDSLVLGLLRDEWEKQQRVKDYGGSCCENFECKRMERLARKAPSTDDDIRRAIEERYTADNVVSGPDPDDWK